MCNERVITGRAASHRWKILIPLCPTITTTISPPTHSLTPPLTHPSPLLTPYPSPLLTPHPSPLTPHPSPLPRDGSSRLGRNKKQRRCLTSRARSECTRGRATGGLRRTTDQQRKVQGQIEKIHVKPSIPWLLKTVSSVWAASVSHISPLSPPSALHLLPCLLHASVSLCVVHRATSTTVSLSDGTCTGSDLSDVRVQYRCEQ